MKVQKAAVRALPALLMLVAVVFLGDAAGLDLGRQAAGGEEDRLEIVLAPPASPLPCPDVEALLDLSERAAALTGSLALVEKERRPELASEAAAQIRTLQQQASALPGGGELTWTLGDLADALDDYAGGNALAIGAVREASARNAGARSVLQQQQSICGGTK